MPESYGCAFLDAGCSTALCGEDLLENHGEYMSEHERSYIIVKPSTSTFTLEKGKKLVPLLLSKKATKKREKILNFETDALTVGDTVALK